jgi:adenylate cyclase
LTFRFTDFEIDIARQELRRGGAIVHIEPQVFDLLVHLVRNRDRIVGKDELIDTIWDGRIVSEATLSSRISAARRALGDNGNDQSLIRTLYKRGFRFVAEVDDARGPAADLTAETVAPQNGTADEPRPPAIGKPPERVEADLEQPAESVAPSAMAAASDQPSAQRDGYAVALAGNEVAAASPARGRNASHRRLPTMAAAGFAAPLAAAGLWLMLPDLSPPPSAAMKASIAPTSLGRPSPQRTADAPSIAVLPFINLSGDAARDYVADGITDSLIIDLARALPGIALVSRDTAFTYKGRSVDARQIGRELKVRYLLEGSVMLEAERVRVNVQLVETKDGSELWAERFDTERKSILQVQDEIVARVSRATGLKVVDVEALRSRYERPTSTEATDLVLRGKAVLNRPSSPATMIEARGLFEQALKVQPQEVDGLAGVATTLVFEFLNDYYRTDNDERLARAERLLDQAGGIDPRNLMVLKARAALRRAQGKFEDAIAAAQAIIAENPGEPWAYKEIGLSTMYLGRPADALEWFAKADQIGPRDPGRWTWLDARGHALILLGRDEEAVRALISALDANPGAVSPRAFLAAAYALLGRTEDARRPLAEYLQAHPEARVSTFRRLSPVPLVLTGPSYQEQLERIKEGLREAGLPE